MYGFDETITIVSSTHHYPIGCGVDAVQSTATWSHSDQPQKFYTQNFWLATNYGLLVINRE